MSKSAETTQQQHNPVTPFNAQKLNHYAGALMVVLTGLVLFQGLTLD